MVSVEIRGPVSRSERIAGGFILIPVHSLIAAWRACRVRPLGIGDFRAWLAVREMTGRRSACPGDDRSPTYSLAELAKLLGVQEKRARAASRRLEAAGLLEWSESAITFPEPLSEPVGSPIEDSIGGGRGSVAIPRRLLRYLTCGGRPALIATALGVLLRCLSRRKGGFDGRGRVKAGWIAKAFAIEPRRVKQARAELVALGWIEPEPADQWTLNRWGRAYRIDLGWIEPGRAGGRSLAPPPVDSGPSLAPPDSDREPLREIRNQEPGPAGPAGVWSSEMDRAKQSPPEPETLPRPRLEDVRVEDLKDTGRLLELHEQAVDRGVVSASEADRLAFVASAEHALSIGKGNPAGLFAYLIRGRLWRYLTQQDEDRASSRLKARHLAGSPSRSDCRGARSGIPTRESPSDEDVVQAVRSAAIRAGIFRDPYPDFARMNPEWTRERWDSAMVHASCKM